MKFKSVLPICALVVGLVGCGSGNNGNPSTSPVDPVTSATVDLHWNSFRRDDALTWLDNNACAANGFPRSLCICVLDWVTTNVDADLWDRWHDDADLSQLGEWLRGARNAGCHR